MLIYLIGFMGCGKTKIGNALAKKLNYKFIDLDELIEEQAGKKILEIFEDKDGQDKFRMMESEMLRKVSSLKENIISTGGGTPCFNNNMELMNSTGTTIYIKMEPASLFHRLAKSKQKRPLIKDLPDIQLLEFIFNTLAKREQFYLQAKYTVKGENLKTGKILGLISEE